MAARPPKPARKKASSLPRPAGNGRFSRPVHQARSRAMRDRLLAAAQDVFAEKGYEGARIADIAARAGASVGAVYLRFKDKDTLFNGIAEAFIEEARGGVESILAEQPDRAPAQLIRLFVHNAAAQLGRYRGMVRAILERGFGRPELLGPLIAVRAEIQKSLYGIVYGSGRKPRDNDFAIGVVSQIIYGFILNSVVNPMALSNVHNDRALDALADVVNGYLGLDQGERK